MDLCKRSLGLVYSFPTLASSLYFLRRTPNKWSIILSNSPDSQLNESHPTMPFALLPPSSTPVILPLKILKPTSPLLHLSIAPLPLNRYSKSALVPRPLSLTAVSPASGLAHIEDKPKTSLPTSSYEEPEVPFSQGLEESVLLLKRAAKSRKVPSADVLAAISDIKKAKVDASSFLEILGGSKSPGRTWMLIFTAQGRLDKGTYFPVTAVQRFDAEAKRIENGIYLGPIGRLTFEGKFSWKKRIMAFLFEYLRIQIGPFSPLEISLGKQEREPNSKGTLPSFGFTLTMTSPLLRAEAAVSRSGVSAAVLLNPMVGPPPCYIILLYASIIVAHIQLLRVIAFYDVLPTCMVPDCIPAF